MLSLNAAGGGGITRPVEVLMLLRQAPQFRRQGTGRGPARGRCFRQILTSRPRPSVLRRLFGPFLNAAPGRPQVAIRSQ